MALRYFHFLSFIFIFAFGVLRTLLFSFWIAICVKFHSFGSVDKDAARRLIIIRRNHFANGKCPRVTFCKRDSGETLFHQTICNSHSHERTTPHMLHERHSRLYIDILHTKQHRRKFIDFPSHKIDTQVSSMRIYFGVYKFNVVEQKIAQIIRFDCNRKIKLI